MHLCLAVKPQKVVVPNKHGEKLVGLLHETGSKEIVILCHGLQATKVVVLIKNCYMLFCLFQLYYDLSGNSFILFFLTFIFRLQERKLIVNIAVALENEGISAFRFDFSGNG